MIQDKNSINLKFPDRTCKSCTTYPCFIGIEKCKSDFAKYGCIYFKEIKSS